MFEITWWCVVVSLLLGTVVWLDARRYPAGARVPPVAWAIVVGVTWVGIAPYVVLRVVQRSRAEREAAVSGGASISIPGAPERVWDMVTDVTRMGEWSPETVRAEWLDGATGAAVGARFKGYNRRGKARWSTVCEVTEAVPGRSFAFAVGGAAKPETIWRYQFEPVGDGVKVTETFELVKPLGFLSRLLTRLTTGVRDRPADLEAGVRSTLSRLKQVATDASATTHVY